MAPGILWADQTVNEVQRWNLITNCLPSDLSFFLSRS